jgi:hypothetical protein
MGNPEIRVTGLRELRKALKDMEGDDTWKQELKDAGRDAAEVVAAEGRSLAARGATTLAGTHASMGSAAISPVSARWPVRHGQPSPVGAHPSRTSVVGTSVLAERTGSSRARSHPTTHCTARLTTSVMR